MGDAKEIEPKVIAKKILETTMKDSSGKKGVDKQMLALALGIQEGDDFACYEELLTDNAHAVRLMLKKARSTLINHMPDELEQLAVQLSHGAMKLGAQAMFGLCINLQSWARRKDWQEATQLMNELELEYLRVRDDLENLQSL
jgi:hypothetical protein